MSTLETTQRKQKAAETPSTPNIVRIVSLILVAVGIAITAYLSYTKLTNTAVQCVEGGAFNCEIVQGSVYSKMFGIPVAYLGFATYLTLGALLILENRIAFLREYGVMLFFGITLFAFLFSMWLVYVQVFRLEALCPWCLAHEVTMTLLFIASGLRLRKSLMASD